MANVNAVTPQPESARTGRITGIVTEYPSKWATNLSGTACYQGQLFHNDHFGRTLAFMVYGQSQDRGSWHDNAYFRSTKVQPSIPKFSEGLVDPNQRVM